MDTTINIFLWISLLQSLRRNVEGAQKPFIYLKGFTNIYFLFSLLLFFSFSLTKACLPGQLRKAYAVLWAANCFAGLKTPRHNGFDQFWKFKLHFEYFPRNAWFLSFDGPSNYLYVFKDHQQTFPWLGERTSSHLKITKMWFGQNIKHLPESFFADFRCREGISCFFLKLFLLSRHLSFFLDFFVR